MKIPTVLRVIAVLIVPVALSFPAIAAGIIIPWLDRTLGVDPKSDAAAVTCILWGLALFMAPLCLFKISQDLEEKP